MINDQESSLIIEQSPPLVGVANLFGAKNSVLAIMAALPLADGIFTLRNVPASADVEQMIILLQELGTTVSFDSIQHVLTVDTSGIHSWSVRADIMQKMRASIFVAGPLLARFGRADIALPGGCAIGSRPIDYHVKAFATMGVSIEDDDHIVRMRVDGGLKAAKVVFDYPSVGATENAIMAALSADGVSTFINASLEPQVMDLICFLQKMGAQITVLPSSKIVVEGGCKLNAVEYEIMPDWLEAGSILLAVAATGGTVYLPQARESDLEIVLYKLKEMGHEIEVDEAGVGIRLTATDMPQAVSFKTGPYPGFPTDLQAPMMVLQTVANGSSCVQETVFENRLIHVPELQKMGASISVTNNKAEIIGVQTLQGAHVAATDIRASCALVIAGLIADGATHMSGIHHWRRGYEALEDRLQKLGACITLTQKNPSKSMLTSKAPQAST